MRIRVTGRFYLVLILIILLVVFIFRDSLFASSEVTHIYGGNASDTRTVQGLIVRDETSVTRDTQVDRIQFVAAEASMVNQGDVVAYVYTSAYAEKLINDLSAKRKDIQTYHKLVLGNELDSTLNELNLTVQQRALELKAQIRGDVRGSLVNAVQNLSSSMEDRRSYMRSSQMSDARLVKLYDDENQTTNAISGWQTPKLAPRSGLISFYMDGYESALNADTIGDLTIAEARSAINGESIGDAPKSKKDENIYRVMDQNHWYMALVGTDSDWNPTLDTVYSFIMDGYDELLYEGTVVRVQKDGSTVMAILEVTRPIGSLMYARSGSVHIGADMYGLIVSKKAVDTQSGQKGVWKYDVPGGTFVAIEVLTDRNDGTVLFVPLTDGVLQSGDQVLIK